MNPARAKRSVTPSAPNRLRVFALAACLSTFAVATGCAYDPFNDPTGGIPPTTEMALSPNGKRLLVSWRESAKKTQGKLLTLSGKTVASVRDVTLPADTFTTAWSRSEDHVLVTTRNDEGSELLRIDLNADVPTLLYKSASVMRFPLEVSDGNYVFLEGMKPGEVSSQWRLLQGGQKTLFNDKLYGLAAPLDQVQGSVFLLEPTLTFRVFQGKLPAGLQALVDPSTWVIRCADKTPLTCVRTHLYFGPTGQSFGTMEIFNGGRRCGISGRWLDEREVQISRDGSTVVFHAAIADVDGPRAIYIVKNDGLDCTPEQFKIQGGK